MGDGSNSNNMLSYRLYGEKGIIMEKKIARIRYEKGNGDQKTVRNAEGFCFEIWDNQIEQWSLATKAICTKSIKDPQNEENDFIHWSILAEIARYSEMGYTITM